MEEVTKKNKKVCIVDDEPNIRDIYQTALQASGYDVVTAVDGVEGLKIIREQKPDIILADIMMPNMDGMEMIKEVKKDSELSLIPIVIMSNVDDSEMLKKAGTLDTRFYLIKSLFGPQKVVAIVDEVLHNK